MYIHFMYIYTLTLSSFRGFLLSKAKSVMSAARRPNKVNDEEEERGTEIARQEETTL